MSQNNQFPDGLPYSKVDPEQKRRASQELLAKYCQIWDAQTESFVQKQDKCQQQIPHIPVMNRDREFREKQRELARAEVHQRQCQEISWQHSLRTDERMVEMKMGRVNQVGYMKKQEPYSIAVKNLCEMPEKVSPNELLDSDLAEQNKQFLQQRTKQAVYQNENYEEVIELPIDQLDQATCTDEEVNQARINITLLQDSQASENSITQSNKPMGKDAQLADQIAQQIVESNRDSDEILHHNQINKKTNVEPLYFVGSTTNPSIMINNLTCISSNSTSSSSISQLIVTNIGDCSVELSIRQREQTQVQHEIQISTKEQKKQLYKLEKQSQQDQNDVVSQGSKSDQLRQQQSHAPHSQDHLQNTTSILNVKRSIFDTLRDTQTAMSPKVYQSDMQSMTFAHQSQISRPVLQKKDENAAVDDMQSKLLEKSSTPSHLRILANRYVNVDRGNVESKIIVATPGNKWQCVSQQQTSIKFIMPNTGDKTQPGIILQEYELTIKPPVKVSFQNLDDQKSGHNCIIQHHDYTSVFVRCYGISNQCLQLSKQLKTLDQVGQRMASKFYDTFMCNDLLFEMCHSAIDFSERKRQDRKQSQNSKKQVVDQQEIEVKRIYSQGIIKAKWLKDRKLIKHFLYKLIGDEAGHNVTLQDVFGPVLYSDRVTSFDEVFDPVMNIFVDLSFLGKSNETKLPECLPPEYLEFCKNSLYYLLGQARNNQAINFHIKHADLQLFDQYRQNNAKILRKRLISMFSDDNTNQNIVINNISEAETAIFHHAVSDSPAVIALFSQFKQTKLVKMLIDKVLNLVLQVINKQIFVNKVQLESYAVNTSNQIVARRRAGYDTNFVNLMLLAASVALLTPVCDIFSILQIKHQMIQAVQPQISIPTTKVQSPTQVSAMLVDFQEPEVVIDNYAQVKHFLKDYLLLVKIKTLLYQKTQKVLVEPDTKVLKKGEEPPPKQYFRQYFVQKISQNLSNKRDLTNFSLLYTSQRSNHVFYQDTAVLLNIIQLLLDNSVMDDRVVIDENDIVAVASDISMILEREYQYVMTIKNRQFLQLYFDEMTNINLVDPFQICKDFQNLTQNLYKHNTYDHYISEYYKSLFTIVDEKSHSTYNMYEEMINDFDLSQQQQQQQQQQQNEAKNAKASKVIFNIQELPPIQHPYFMISGFTFHQNDEHSYVQSYKNQLERDEQPIVDTKSKAKGKVVAELKQVKVVNSVQGRLFQDFELFDNNSVFLFNQICEKQSQLLMQQPIFKLQLQTALCDCVNLIIQLSALPYHQYFDNFEIQQDMPLIRQHINDKRQLKLNEVGKIMLDYGTKANQTIESKQKDPKKKMNVSESPTDLGENQQSIKMYIDQNISQVAFADFNQIITSYKFQNLPEQDDTMHVNEVDLETTRVIESELPHTSKRALAMQGILEDDTPLPFNNQNDDNFSEKDDQDLTKHDFEHDLRIEIMKEEFFVFIDAILTDYCDQATKQFEEIIDEFDSAYNDFQVQQEKIIMIEQGELTIQEAGFDEQEFEEAKTASAPLMPHPKDVFIKEIQGNNRLEQIVTQQSIVYFSQGYQQSSLILLIELLVETIKQVIQEARIVLKQGFELEYIELQYDDYFNKFLFELQCLIGLEQQVLVEKTKKDIVPVLPYQQRNIQDAVLLCNQLARLFGFAVTADYTYIQQNQSTVQQVFKIENSDQLKLQQFNENTISCIKQSLHYNYINLFNFLNLNPNKLNYKPSIYSFLTSPIGIYNTPLSYSAECKEYLFQLTPEFIKQFVETNQSQIKLPNKVDSKKKGDQQAKSPGRVNHVQQEKQIVQSEVLELHEEEYFENEIDELPPYQREASPETETRRAVWSYLLNQTLERATRRFAVVEKAEFLFGRGLNYLVQPWENLYDE